MCGLAIANEPKAIVCIAMHLLNSLLQPIMLSIFVNYLLLIKVNNQVSFSSFLLQNELLQIYPFMPSLNGQGNCS